MATELELETDQSRDERKSWVEPELAVTSLKEAMSGPTGSLDVSVGYS